MLDALKFAFEIFIVGALALPWIEVLYRMFPQSSSPNSRFDLTFVPKEARNVVSVAIVVAVGYLLGTAISRFSQDFFNDELWQKLPTEDTIRESVYFDEFCKEEQLPFEYWSKPIHLAPVNEFCPNQKAVSINELPKEQREQFDHRVQEVFRLEDSELLLQGVDRVDRLKQYFDQITVLRGAALNGFILLSLALFGACGRVKERWPRHRLIMLMGFLPSASLGIFTATSLWKHWFEHNKNLYGDPPLAETTLLLLSAVGLFMAWKPERNLPYLRICAIAVVALIISFGGWWWTEVTYDLQVIHSLAEFKHNNILTNERNLAPADGSEVESPRHTNPR